jgi:hypothetical protein
MLKGELRNQIDSIWNDFWSGGLANPLQVIEQITYLIFIKRLDEMQELEERKATTLGKPIERRIFPEGKDERGEPYTNLRWSPIPISAPLLWHVRLLGRLTRHRRSCRSRNRRAVAAGCRDWRRCTTDTACRVRRNRTHARPPTGDHLGYSSRRVRHE